MPNPPCAFRKCPSCGSEVAQAYLYCPDCGSLLDEPMGRKTRAPRLRLTRRRLLVLAALVLLAIALFFYAFQIEPNRVVERRIELTIPGLPKALVGFRIVHLTDTHISRFGNRERRAVQIVNDAHPDIIVLTGDYAGGAEGPRDESADKIAAEVLSKLRSKYGVYAIYGSWESPDMRAKLTQINAHVLMSSFSLIDVKGQRVVVAGLEEEGRSVKEVLRHAPADALKILLAEEITPESTDHAASQGVSISLTGCRHGGQIRIPIISRFYGRTRRPGLELIDGKLWHYASPGLGTSKFRARFLCPPEVAIITLRAA